ncbi:S-layer homology domain-containing protein, partial [Candidatus Micrarchaeota archaeon]|nr:S-layer homology domain-containing protein [Candidatus Micrarchaeota archaeon]
MKNVLMKIMVLAIFVLFLPFANARTFTDVPTNYWAYSAINFVSDLGVMNGVSSTTFAPSSPATRASAAVTLVKAFNLPLNTTGGPHFTDVSTTHWAYAYIETLYNKGISTGCGNGKYCPDQAISRAQFTVLMVKSLGLTLTTSTRSSFPDVSTTHWAFKYIQTAQENGFVVGYTNGNFGPEDNALRDQLAVMLNRAIEAVYSFTDVPTNHWAYTPIVYVAERGIMTGVNSTSFAPSQSLKRDAAAVVVVRALGLTLNTTGGPHFTDVPTTHWAYAFIETLYNKGISSGCGNGKYCPDQAISRAQFTVLMVKSLGLTLTTSTRSSFPDVSTT